MDQIKQLNVQIQKVTAASELAPLATQLKVCHRFYFISCIYVLFDLHHVHILYSVAYYFLFLFFPLLCLSSLFVSSLLVDLMLSPPFPF